MIGLFAIDSHPLDFFLDGLVLTSNINLFAAVVHASFMSIPLTFARLYLLSNPLLAQDLLKSF
jgi:hypothetical protein